MYATRPQNTTSINELPDLEELDGMGSNLIEEVDPKYQKFIKNPHSPPMESGMIPPPHQVERPYQPSNYQPMGGGGLEQITDFKELQAHTPSCLDVCSHVMSCPICSKFYNNDKTLYIMAIVILTIICVILLKKVLDV